MFGEATMESLWAAASPTGSPDQLRRQAQQLVGHFESCGAYTLEDAHLYHLG
ncbi:hypothetical protein [Bradyrhizobium sp. CCBAU 45389]|uniref:hypothetical protein n=1 Tax=Bradyrhizobium sp. CCBAU 45389 TaxID=858429 RepID=UPI002306064A|nr:hypothetical protein [Bradyrhizobium sp. CCBAU 45389]